MRGRERIANRLRRLNRDTSRQRFYLNEYSVFDIIRQIQNYQNSNRNMRLIMNIDNITYRPLSNNNVNLLEDFIAGYFATEEPENQSDEETIQSLLTAQYIEIEVAPNTQERRRGAFFKYYNKTKLDLSKYGIFHNDDDFIDEQCLIQAFRCYGLDENKILSVRQMIRNKSIPSCKLSEIANLIECNILLENIRTDGKGRNKKHCPRSKPYDETINIGIIDNHYVFNEDCEELFSKLNIKTRQKKDTLGLIQTLLINKDTLLKEIDLTEKMMGISSYHKELTNYKIITDNKNLYKKSYVYMNKKEDEYTNIYFDFETYQSYEGITKPYLVCMTTDDNDDQTFYNERCGLKLLDYISKKYNKVRMIAHNCSFDICHIISYLSKIYSDKTIMKRRSLYMLTGRYKNTEIVFKDSYKMITMPLRKFGKSFGLKTEKEIMCYRIYDDKYERERIYKKFQFLYLKEEMKKEGKSDEDIEQYMDNIKKWGLKIDKEHFNHIDYSARYCMIDCKVLRDGYNKYGELLKELDERLDINNLLTSAKMADTYLKLNGCYDDCYFISGVVRRFIEESVVGGRVMTRRNEQYELTEDLDDFDAKSLYPSSMIRLGEEYGGFLKGTPKSLKDNELNMDFLDKTDGYFIEVEITKVNIHRDFPYLSIRGDDRRTFTNELVGQRLVVNKIDVENMIQFQDMEFNIIRGVYFNEGRNPMIKDVMKTLYIKRNEAKREGNPVDAVYKEAMNSSYGKTIQKEVDTQLMFIDGEDELKKQIGHKFNDVNEYTNITNSDKYLMKINKPTINHFNMCHIGSEILSVSKKIMCEVMCLAEDLGIKMYYTDTDSIHIESNKLDLLNDEYRRKYNRELIGEDVGQFHSDFDVPGENSKSIRSIFLGKKTYIDEIEYYEDGERKLSYHFRMKGIPHSCILYKMKQLKLKNPFQLYQLLLKNRMSFDLTEGGTKINFDFNKDFSINNRKVFERVINFTGKPLDETFIL